MLAPDMTTPTGQFLCTIGTHMNLLTILVPRECFSQFLAINVDIESNGDQNLWLQGSLVQQLRHFVIVAVRK